MIGKIETIDDVKRELMRYFKTLNALPAVKLPSVAKNRLYQLIVSTPTYEDDEAEAERFMPDTVDISDCWYVDENIMRGCTKFEYRLLAARIRERPLPWKALEYEFKKSRQMLRLYLNKALKGCLKRFNGGV